MFNNTHVILASESPRRKELLNGTLDSFTIKPANIDESMLANEEPASHTVRLATAKAKKVSLGYENAIIIGADTIVVINNEVPGKPSDETEAKTMLNKLSGKTHRVITSYCILNTSTKEVVTDTVESMVTIKELTDNEIADYIATGEPMDKAGSYAVQGIGKKLVEGVEGSYTNVIGLPMESLESKLESILK